MHKALAAIIGFSMLPVVATQADHYQGHEEWERRNWGTYTTGPTPSITSPHAGQPRKRYKSVPVITIDSRTGQTYPGAASVPYYCGEDDC